MEMRPEVRGPLFYYEMETAKMFGYTQIPSRMRHGGHVCMTLLKIVFVLCTAAVLCLKIQRGCCDLARWKEDPCYSQWYACIPEWW